MSRFRSYVDRSTLPEPSSPTWPGTRPALLQELLVIESAATSTQFSDVICGIKKGLDLHLDTSWYAGRVASEPDQHFAEMSFPPRSRSAVHTGGHSPPSSRMGMPKIDIDGLKFTARTRSLGASRRLPGKPAAAKRAKVQASSYGGSPQDELPNCSAPVSRLPSKKAPQVPVKGRPANRALNVPAVCPKRRSEALSEGRQGICHNGPHGVWHVTGNDAGADPWQDSSRPGSKDTADPSHGVGERAVFHGNCSLHPEGVPHGFTNTAYLAKVLRHDSAPHPSKSAEPCLNDAAETARLLVREHGEETAQTLLLASTNTSVVMAGPCRKAAAEADGPLTQKVVEESKQALQSAPLSARAERAKNKKIGAKMLMSDLTLGGRTIDAPASDEAKARWKRASILGSTMKALTAEVVEQSVSKATSRDEEEDIEQLTALQPVTKEEAYWQKHWELAKKLMRQAADDDKDSACLPSPAEPHSCPDQSITKFVGA